MKRTKLAFTVCACLSFMLGLAIGIGTKGEQYQSVNFVFDAKSGAFIGMQNETPFGVTNISHMGNGVFQFQMLPMGR